MGLLCAISSAWTFIAHFGGRGIQWCPYNDDQQHDNGDHGSGDDIYLAEIKDYTNVCVLSN